MLDLSVKAWASSPQRYIDMLRLGNLPMLEVRFYYCNAVVYGFGSPDILDSARQELANTKRCVKCARRIQVYMKD